MRMKEGTSQYIDTVNVNLIGETEHLLIFGVKGLYGYYNFVRYGA